MNPQAVAQALRPETALPTIMHANNEVSTFQSLDRIGKIAGQYSIPFHIDAVQSVGKTPIDVSKLRADMLTIAGHKLYGPKG